MIDFSFETIKKKVRETFEFAKKLEIVEESDFEQLFSDEKLKKAGYAGSLWHLIEFQLRTVDHIHFSYINKGQNIAKIMHHQMHNITQTEAEINNVVTRILGGDILERAVEKGTVYEFNSSYYGLVIDAINDKIPSLKAEVDLEVLQDKERVIKVKTSLESGTKRIQLVHDTLLFEILDVMKASLNTYLPNMTFVKVETRPSLHTRFMFIPNEMLTEEDNPYIPFYHKINLRVVRQDKITQEDLDSAVLRYSQPPMDDGRWLYSLVGDKYKELMEPNIWAHLYREKGIEKPLLLSVEETNTKQ